TRTTRARITPPVSSASRSGRGLFGFVDFLEAPDADGIAELGGHRVHGPAGFFRWRPNQVQDQTRTTRARISPPGLLRLPIRPWSFWLRGFPGGSRRGWDRAAWRSPRPRPRARRSWW